MALTNLQLKYYDANVLRLPADKRTEYHEQVDRLIKNLKQNIRDKLAIRITRVVKAGSFAKFTILRRTSNDPVDVDVVFYISGEDAGDQSFQELSDRIYDLLIQQYPNKSVEDFEIQHKAATVTFVGSGISVDVVPVVTDDARDGYGWQFERSGSRMETCAPCQIQFVRDRKNVDANYRTLVRLAKKWRNYQEVDKLKSFAIELIMAYLLDTRGSAGSIEQRFKDFLLYIAQSGLKETISFPENTDRIPVFNSPVVIVDPVSSTNNVASRLSESERADIVAAATAAWEVAHFASAEDDHDAWKELFGPKFQTEDSQ